MDANLTHSRAAEAAAITTTAAAAATPPLTSSAKQLIRGRHAHRLPESSQPPYEGGKSIPLVLQ